MMHHFEYGRNIPWHHIMIPFQLTDCNQRKILTADVCQILKDLLSLAPIGIQINHWLVWHGTFEYIYSFLLYRKRIHSAASPPLANAPQAARVRISCTCAERLIFTTGTTILFAYIVFEISTKVNFCLIDFDASSLSAFSPIFRLFIWDILADSAIMVKSVRLCRISGDQSENASGVKSVLPASKSSSAMTP